MFIVVNDDIPELDETCVITLLQAAAIDNNIGDAVLRTDSEDATIIIRENDDARGVFLVDIDSREQTGMLVVSASSRDIPSLLVNLDWS
jgi:hypothetical protein